MTEVAAIERLVPGCRIDGELGSGGFSRVFGGRHVRLQRRLAVKQLTPSLAADADLRRRFVAEARVLGGFDHPHIVTVYDFADDEDRCILVMEELSGGTVTDRWRRRDLSLPDALAITLAGCEALSYAHDRGVLHRDVKPANLLFSADGVMKVVDFGIAKVIGGTQSVATADGTVLGSPLYMAPEQVVGVPLTPATDVHSLATVLYELVAGHTPFADEGDAMSVMVAKANRDPPGLDVVADLDAPLAAVVARAHDRDPTVRPPDARAFGCDLAAAATRALGRGWLGASEIPVFASGPLAVALDGSRDASGAPAAPAPTVVLSPESAGTVITEAAARHMPFEGPEPASPGGAGAARPSVAPDAAHPPPLPSGPRLVVAITEPGRPSRSVTLVGPTTFGRKDCDVVLADEQCSRQHFRIAFDDDAPFVEDIGSTNGTVLDGIRVHGRAPLGAGGSITAGGTTVVAGDAPGPSVGRRRRVRRSR